MSQTNQHLRRNSAMNGGSVSARTSSYKTSSNVLNKTLTITPTSSGTIISTSSGVINTIGPLVTYQAVNTPIQPYRILTNRTLPSTATNSGQNFANSNQILNFSTLTYGNNSYPNRNIFITTDDLGASASGYGCTTGQNSQNTSSVANKPETAPKPKNPRGSQKPKSIKVSRKKLTSLDVDSKKKLTAASLSVANYMKQDISDKEIEVMEQMDDQSYNVVVTKVMDIANRTYGDDIAEHLTKHLGQEKYDEIAKSGIDGKNDDIGMVQSVFKRQADLFKENDHLKSARSALAEKQFELDRKNNDLGMVQSESNKGADLYRENDQLESARSSVADPGTVQKCNVIVESVRPEELIGCRKDVSSGVAVKTEDGANGQGTQKNVPPQQTTPPTPTAYINYAKVSGFLLTDDTKAMTEEVLAQEEKLAADMIITEKIDELKKMDTSDSSTNESSFEDKWSFNCSKISNGLPDKIFESPEEQQAKKEERFSKIQYLPKQSFLLDSAEKNKSRKKEDDKQSLIKCNDAVESIVKEENKEKNLVQLDGAKNGCDDRASSVGFTHVTAENSSTPIASSDKTKTDDPSPIVNILKGRTNLTYTKSYTLVNKHLKIRSKNVTKTTKTEDCFHEYDPLLSNSSESISETINLTSSSEEISAESSSSSVDSPKVIAELLSPAVSRARGVSKKLGRPKKETSNVVHVENSVGGSCNATSTPKKDESKLTQSRQKFKTVLSSLKSTISKPTVDQTPEVSVCVKNNCGDVIHTEKFTKLTKIHSDAVLITNGFPVDVENKQEIVPATPETKKEINVNFPILRAKITSSINKENRKISNKENAPVSQNINKQEINFVQLKPVLKEQNTFQSKYVEQVEKLKNILSAKEFWNTGQKFNINPVSVIVHNNYTKAKGSKASPNKRKQYLKNNSDLVNKEGTTTAKVSQSPNLVKDIPKEKLINVIDHQIIKPSINVIDHQIIKPSWDNNFTKLEDHCQEQPAQEPPSLSVTPEKLLNDCVTSQIKQPNEDFSSKALEAKPEPAGLENKGRSESPDIETSMNDLAELLMSLQESEPIYSCSSASSKDNKKDQDYLEPKMATSNVEDTSVNDAAQTLIDIQRSSGKIAKISPDTSVKVKQVHVSVDLKSIDKAIKAFKAADNPRVINVVKDSPKVPVKTECILNESSFVGNHILPPVTDQTVLLTSPEVQNKCAIDAVKTPVDIQLAFVETAEISTVLNIKTEPVDVSSNAEFFVEVTATDGECIVIDDDDDSPEVPDCRNFESKDELNVSEDGNKDASVVDPLCLPVMDKKVVLPSNDLQDDVKVVATPGMRHEPCNKKIEHDKLRKVDDDCIIVEASGPIMDTPLGFGNTRRYSDPFFRRRLRKLNEQKQRNFLRNRVKHLSRIILERIRTVERTYVHFRALVRFIIFNINNTSLDNMTLRSKVRNLKALYRKISRTVVDLRRKKEAKGVVRRNLGRKRLTYGGDGAASTGAGSWERRVGGREMTVGNDKELTEKRIKVEHSYIGKYEDEVLAQPMRTYTKENNTRRPSVSKICTTPSKKCKLSPNLCFMDDIGNPSLDCASEIKKNIFSLPGKKSPTTSPEDHPFIKPTKTYSKPSASRISKSDSSIYTTPHNKANVLFNRSRSFIDDIRESSLDRDDRVDKNSSPESIVRCIIYKNATPILNSINQTAKWKIVEIPEEEVENEPWPDVVIKKEPEDYFDEKIVDSPKTGQKRKRKTNKQIEKPTVDVIKEEPYVCAKEIGPVKNPTPTCAMSLRSRTGLSEVPKQMYIPRQITPRKKKMIGDAKSTTGKNTPSQLTKGKRRKTDDAKSPGKDFETTVRKLREKKNEDTDATPPTRNKKFGEMKNEDADATPPTRNKKSVKFAPVVDTALLAKKPDQTHKKGQKTPVLGQKYSLRERRAAGNNAAGY